MTKEEKIVTCRNYSREMVSGKCPFNYNCEVVVESEDKEIDLTIFPEVVKIIINETNIEEELLTSKNLNISYNNKKKIIAVIKKHEEQIQALLLSP